MKRPQIMRRVIQTGSNISLFSFWERNIRMEKLRLVQQFPNQKDEVKQELDFLCKGNLSQEDQVLKMLRDDQGVKKWSVIAQKMQNEFKIIGKSGKKCRERYQSRLNKNLKQDQWTADEDLTLLRLHNEKGNRWVQIAKVLGRSDNAVKNHYHSKLRKALRKINCLLASCFKNEFKPLKNNIISKVLQTAENYKSQQDIEEAPHSKLCYILKNKILDYLSVSDKLNSSEQLQLRTMVKQINQFNKMFKKKVHSKNDSENDLSKVGKYKGKQILSLINQNKNNLHGIDKEESPQEESESEESSEPKVRKEKQNFLSNISPAQNDNKKRQPSEQLKMMNQPHFGPVYPSYPFSFFGNFCQPNPYDLYSYNYLLHSRSPFNWFPFPQNGHMLNYVERTSVGNEGGAKQKKEVILTCLPSEGL